MKISKIATLGVSVLTAAALTGCSSTSGGGGSVTMTLVEGTKGSPFYDTMACGANAKAKSLHVKLKVAAPAQFDPSLMAPVLNSVTAQKPDAALVVPVDRTALDQALTQMKSAGIKIVNVDQTVTDKSLSVSDIASDDAAGGRLAADTMAKLIGKKGSVVVITAPPGSAAQDARTAAFQQELKKYPGITYLGAQYQRNDVQKSASIVTSTLAGHGDLAGVFSTNDIGAEGAVTGLKDAKAVGKVKLVAYDGDKQEVDALKAGSIQALIAQDPYLEGQDAVEQAFAAVKGKRVTRTIDTPLVSLTTADPPAKLNRYTYKSTC